MGADTSLVFDTRSLYRAFRRASHQVGSQGVAFKRNRLSIRMPEFRSHAHGRLPPEERDHCENTSFRYPLFVTEEAGRDVVVLLNGLNDTGYRKFFPWAASLAARGVPTIVFPIALMMNRHPVQWTHPLVVGAALSRRRTINPLGEATMMNAQVSQRLGARPDALLQQCLQTCDDLCQLARDAAEGRLRRTAGLVPGTRLHLLGYSLGGYIALALKLCGPRSLFDGSHVTVFCSGAPVWHPDPSARVDPVSPDILDAAAAKALSAWLSGAVAGPPESLGSMLHELLSSSSEATRTRLGKLGPKLTVIASATDRVMPHHGIRDNLGRVDRTVATGSHEYPFSVSDVRGADAKKCMARSYLVEGPYREGFSDFVDLVAADVRRAALGASGQPLERQPSHGGEQVQPMSGGQGT